MSWVVLMPATEGPLDSDGDDGIQTPPVAQPHEMEAQNQAIKLQARLQNYDDNRADLGDLPPLARPPNYGMPPLHPKAALAVPPSWVSDAGGTVVSSDPYPPQVDSCLVDARASWLVVLWCSYFGHNFLWLRSTPFSFWTRHSGGNSCYPWEQQNAYVGVK